MPRVLNIPKFLTWQGSQYSSFTKHSEYGRQSSGYISGSKYARILNMQELHRFLNVPQNR